MKNNILNKMLVTLLAFGFLSSGVVLYETIRMGEERGALQQQLQNAQYEIEALRAAASKPTLDPNEVLCLQQNIYFEARNQSPQGRLGVAWVVLNRVQSDSYPNTVCSVVYQAHTKYGQPIKNKCHFSWYCDGKSDRPHLDRVRERQAWIEAGEMARRILLHCKRGYQQQYCPVDPTSGAVYYHSDKVNPYWADSVQTTARIENHIFYAAN